MKSSGKCPKCDSSEIIAEVKALKEGHRQEILLATWGRPDALFLKAPRETSLSAWVCGSCGYVEFYADNPSAIKPSPPP